MTEISKRFEKIINDIENNITDEKQLEFINKKIIEVSMLHLEVIDELTDVIKNKISNIEKTQNSIENKLNKMQNSISGIENDIYDEGFEFEIICPYCNTTFVADVESKTDIKCPECNNTIELDWNGGEEFNKCSGHCSACNSRCGESFFDEFGEDINFIDDKEDDDEDNDDM